MSVKLTNVSGGQLVCDLANNGGTLRLNNKETKIVKDNEVTSHITRLIEHGLVLSKKVVEPKPTTNKKEVAKNGNKEKEE